MLFYKKIKLISVSVMLLFAQCRMQYNKYLIRFIFWALFLELRYEFSQIFLYSLLLCCGFYFRAFSLHLRNSNSSYRKYLQYGILNSHIKMYFFVCNNPFQPNIPFLYALKTSDVYTPDVVREHKNGTLGSNRPYLACSILPLYKQKLIFLVQNNIIKLTNIKPLKLHT